VSKFLEKAIAKIDKLGHDKIIELIQDAHQENLLYEAVLGSISQGIAVLDREDQLLFLNKAAERLGLFFGGEKIGRKLETLIHDEDIARYLKNNLAKDVTVHDKIFPLDHGGSVLILRISILPLVEQGGRDARKIIGTIVSFEDVTEEKSQEARLRRAETLASLTTLTAGVAHEIKNPLGSIGIHLQLLERSLKDAGVSPEGKAWKFLNVIEEEVDRLNRIVVDFLFAVRPMDTQLELGSLTAVLQDLAEFMQYELGENNISLALIPPKEELPINMDFRFLKQAFLNVITNAMAAMPEGGELTMEVISGVGQMEVRISDTGMGIPEEKLEKIFEPYFTTKDFGSGLGLTLVYKIIKEHSGDIQVSSKVGKGTTFTFYFPLPRKEHFLLESSSSADREGE
jgi:two-component system, sporulation sensor kinase E